MKSEEELDALIEVVNEQDEQRAAKLQLLEAHSLSDDPQLIGILLSLRRRGAEVEEAELMSGWGSQRARRKTKHTLLQVVASLDKRIDQLISSHGLLEREGA